MRLMRFPTVHGENVVFSYAGDLWVAKLDGGFARKLTSGTGMEVRPRISPDGKSIAFTANYDGNGDVYVMPIEGGEPERLTFEPENDNVIGWTPDGKIMYTNPRGFNFRQACLWLIDPKGGMPQPTPVKEISEGSISPDGASIAFNRFGSQNFNWRRYRGGSQGRISIMDLKTLRYRELPSRREQSYYPMWVGNSLYYISDRKEGTLNLYRHDLSTGRDTQVTQFNDADIRFPSTDGKTIVWEQDGYLWAFDIASGKSRKLNPLVRSDFTTRRPSLRKVGSNVSGLSISPSGVRFAVEARGELFSVPARNGETRNLTNNAWRQRSPSWSPDGKSIAYLSDESGEMEIYTVPQMGGTPVQLTDAKMPLLGINWSPDSKKIAAVVNTGEVWILDVESKKFEKAFRGAFGVDGFEWSPDSKWIAWTDPGAVSFGGKNLGRVMLYEVASGKSTAVSNGRYNDGSATFDQSGKFLYIVSDRTFRPTFGLYEFSLKVTDTARIYAIPLSKETTNPLFRASDEEPSEPPARPAGPPPGAGGPPPQTAPAKPEIKIDFDGMIDRAIPLPLPAGAYPLVLGSNNGVFYWTPSGQFSRFDLNSGQSTPLGTLSPSQVSVNASRSKIAYVQQGQLFSLDLRPGAQPVAVSLNNVEAEVDPRREWTQMYWEVWRYMRDNFYDPGMMGLNWKALGERYAKYLPFVAHRSDLNYVFGLLIGELGTGHAYVQGMGDPHSTPPPSIPVGSLGVDYAVEGGYVKIAKVLDGANDDEARRSPLEDPGVNVKAGDFLLEIDGKKVDASNNPHRHLQGKANRTVVLTVNDKPSLEGARKVRVRTLASEADLRLWDFVEANRKYVEKATNGRVGYMHIPDTASAGAIELIRGFYSTLDKEALIVDERWNGGGYIQPWFVDTLARRHKAGIQSRNATADGHDAPAQEGPMALLINGYAGSGGDFFPWMFRQAKRGPLIGTRTWGGLVGISGGAPLVDGGSVTAPSFAIYDRETNEIIAENRGVDPDIEVDLRPDLLAQGKDPQLDKAIEHILGQLERTPKPKPRTTIPKLGKEARIDN